MMVTIYGRLIDDEFQLFEIERIIRREERERRETGKHVDEFTSLCPVSPEKERTE